MKRKRLTELRQILVKRFSEGELRTLCFDLGIDYDDLPGEGKANKARELIAFFERHDRVPELVEIVKQLRPSVSWDDMLEATRAETYLDFELHVGHDGRMRACSDEGERTATISLEVPNDVSLAVSLVEKGEADGDLLKKLGKRLYEIIFPGKIDTHFNQTEAVARSKKHKVRIRLTIKPDALARLPWEFTYREEGGYFLAVNPQTVLLRYLDLPLSKDRVAPQEGPLHLLTIVSNPSDQPPLDPDEWEEIVKSALATPHRYGAITIKTVKRATYEEIRNALYDAGKPHIVQFVGHGIYRNGKGYLALVDSNPGGTWIVDDERFANIFLGFDDHLRLVCLATCESAKSDSPQGFLGIAPQIAERGTPAVVAMQYRVLVSTAKIFLENFYTAVAARKPVDWAVQQARNAVSIKKGLDNREFATPVLYMRAKDGNIF